MRTLILFVLLNIIALSSTEVLQAQAGCFKLDSDKECFNGVVSCAFNSTQDHANYGTTVGNLCDELSIKRAEKTAVEKSLSESYASYNEVLGVQATEAINLAVCSNNARILSESITYQVDQISVLQKQIAKLKKRLRRRK